MWNGAATHPGAHLGQHMTRRHVSGQNPATRIGASSYYPTRVSNSALNFHAHQIVHLYSLGAFRIFWEGVVGVGLGSLCLKC